MFLEVSNIRKLGTRKLTYQVRSTYKLKVKLASPVERAVSRLLPKVE